MVKLKKAFALLAGLTLALLAGCQRAQEDGSLAEQVGQRFDALQKAAFHVEILSDLGQSTLEYGLDYTYHKEDSDALTLTAPEIVAGVSASIAGDTTPELTLQYEGTALDAPGIGLPGLTPADAVPYLLCDLRQAAPNEVWSERAQEEALIVLRYVSDGVEKQIWLTEKGYVPVCAELFYEGKRVLQCVFSGWEETETG